MATRRPRVGNVVQTAANKGVLLALVAMAQTFVVLTAGIDLSVGMVFILCNCLASFVVVAGSMPMAIFGTRRRARALGGVAAARSTG